MLTQERLKELLDYDPATGIFTWRVGRQGIRADKRAGRMTPKGYIQIQVEGQILRAHRLAWFYVHGCWPTDQIDHINRVKDDNRIENLREVTNQQNKFNTNAKGYSWNKRDRKWQARIKHNGDLKHLGLYDTEEAARAAYLAAKAELHVM